jgi:multisubunit Na+/H+ antiporter MnhB subunit
MRKPILVIGLITWVFVGTLFLSRWWYANPSVFPHFPDAFWHWLDRLFGAGNVDEASNVEFIAVVFLALVVVLASTALVAAAYRYARKSSQ